METTIIMLRSFPFLLSFVFGTFKCLGVLNYEGVENGTTHRKHTYLRVSCCLFFWRRSVFLRDGAAHSVFRHHHYQHRHHLRHHHHRQNYHHHHNDAIINRNNNWQILIPLRDALCYI